MKTRALKNTLDEIQKKAKERTVRTQTIEYDLETLAKRIDKKILKLNPEYQRKHRWNNATSSRLIESLILNIPIPYIYLSLDHDVDQEIEDGVSRYSVIDGQQRITAIYRFLKNELKLEGLEVLSELNGSCYRDLPPFLERRLEDRTVKCLRIDSTLDSQVKYDIFERLNSGSVELSPQELRNATCRGPFNDLVKKLAKEENFMELAQLKEGSKRVEKMEDEELVLRFFALTYKSGFKNYKGGFKSFLTEKMTEFNSLDESELDKMEKNFKKTFEKIEDGGSDIPFAKYRYNKDHGFKKMSSFNAAVFDSVVVPVSINLKTVDFDYSKFKKLFKNKDFFNAVEGSVNDVAKLTERIELSKAILVK